MTAPCRLNSPEESDQSRVLQDWTCNILVVDDDPAMRSLLIDELQDQGCRVLEAIDGSDALSKVKALTPDLIITDLKMPGGGFDYLRDLRRIAPDCPIILITAFGDSQTRSKAKVCGVTTYMDKPVRINGIRDSITQICRLKPCKNSSPIKIQ